MPFTMLRAVQNLSDTLDNKMKPISFFYRLHQECEVKAIELSIGYYVGMTNQLDGLLDQVNSTRQCKTHECDGKKLHFMMLSFLYIACLLS